MITTSLGSRLALAAETEQVGNTGLNIAIFAAFVAVTLYFVLRASKTNKSASDMYTAGSAFTGRQNGVAISGDYMSAASFLGIAGLIFLYGFDGFLYSIGFLVAFLTVMFLLAERMRNAGKYTIAFAKSRLLAFASAPFDQTNTRGRRRIIRLPGVGHSDRFAIIDIDDPQHRNLRHAAHPVIGRALSVDQPLFGHVLEQGLELDLLLPLQAKGAGNLPLARRFG